MGDRVHKKERVPLMTAMPVGFKYAFWRQATWDCYAAQYLTRDELVELRTLWLLARDVDLVCRRLQAMTDGGVWLQVGAVDNGAVDSTTTQQGGPTT